MYECRLQSGVVIPLVRCLCRNRFLLRISLVFESMISGSACLNALVRGLSYNGYAVKLTMTDSSGVDWATYSISRILQRNRDILDRAATFVLQSRVDKWCARSFQYLQAAASVVPHVVLLSGGALTMGSAADAVQSAKCRLRGHCGPECLRSATWPLSTERSATSVEETPHSC